MKATRGIEYPDARSRSEKGGLKRHEEPCVVDEKERSGATALPDEVGRSAVRGRVF